MLEKKGTTSGKSVSRAFCASISLLQAGNFGRISNIKMRAIASMCIPVGDNTPAIPGLSKISTPVTKCNTHLMTGDLLAIRLMGTAADGRNPIAAWALGQLLGTGVAMLNDER